MKTKSTSDIVKITEGRWGDIWNKRFEKIIKAGVGLLAGAVKTKYGLIFSIIDAVGSALPETVSSSTRVEYKVELIKELKIEKFTYVKQIDGRYMLGAKTEFLKFRFQHFITKPGEGTSSGGFTPYEYVKTRYYSNPDKRAWNAALNPWIENIGSIEYNGVHFSAY